MCLQALSRLSQVCFADDIVAVEHASGFVTRQSHRYAIGDSCAHHVAHSRPTQVVNQDGTQQSSRLARS